MPSSHGEQAATELQEVRTEMNRLKDKVKAVEDQAQAAADPALKVALLQQLPGLQQQLATLLAKEERLAAAEAAAAAAARSGAASGSGQAGVGAGADASQGGEVRQRFVKLLQAGRITRPKSEVLDIVEMRCAARMMVCSRPTIAVQLYRDVELFPGASTQQHLFTQHGLTVNGPLYSNPAEGPASLLVATKSTGQPAVVKLLSNLRGDQQPGGTEAAAWRRLYHDMPEGTPLVAADLVILNLTAEHKSTGRGPGQYAALVMPFYPTTVAKLLFLSSSVILQQGRRMKQALEYLHSRDLVHMDMKGANILVDQQGLWWASDFGSAVLTGENIHSTSTWFCPQKDMTGPAHPSIDWHMLAVTLVCELHKQTWKELLIEDGHTPLHRLEAAVNSVTDDELKDLLLELVQLARP